MKIYHYRKTDLVENPWEDILITGDTQLDQYQFRTLASICGQTVIRQHASTYITGKDTCLAHHFVKMIAAAILKGSYDHAPGLTVNNPQAAHGNVLWIDTVRGLHACADFFKEMISNFDPSHKHFSLLCLDKLGSFRFEFFALTRYIEQAIEMTRPSLIIIDDIDHLMPYCGINSADAFNCAIRDALNHTDAACLFIGYNHLNKRANTTGNLGKMLFSGADNIFSVTSQHAISRVKLVKSYNTQVNHEAEFLFTVDEDNLPHEVCKTISEQQHDDFLQTSSLQDIFSQVIEPGQNISPDELVHKLNSRRQQLNRLDRTRALIAQATKFGIIKKADDNSSNYTLSQGSPCRDSVTASPVPVNNSLTLPPTLKVPRAGTPSRPL
jgi:hypothetical protein